MGLRQGRQDGRRTRLHPDAGAGGQADREDLVGRYQELSGNISFPDAGQRRWRRSAKPGPPARPARSTPDRRSACPGRRLKLNTKGIGVADMAVSDVMEAAGPY